MKNKQKQENKRHLRERGITLIDQNVLRKLKSFFLSHFQSNFWIVVMQHSVQPSKPTHPLAAHPKPIIQSSNVGVVTLESSQDNLKGLKIKVPYRLQTPLIHYHVCNASCKI